MENKMPVTGVFNQNQTPLESSDSQFDSTEPLPSIPPLPPSSDNCTPQDAMSEASTDVVSSTTADLVATVMEEPSEQPVSVESTVTELPTSVESAVNTQVQAETPIWSDGTQDTSDTRTSNPIEHEDIPSTSFHQTSNTSFQSAFAAFASATTIQTEAEAMEVEDSCATPTSEVVSNISHDESSPLIEQSVTSTIDSGVVTTTQESLTLSTVSLEPPKNSHVAIEQDDLDSASAIETTGDGAVAPSFAEAQTIENPSVDAQPAIVEAPSSIEVPFNTEVQSTIEPPIERSEQHPPTASEAQPEIDSSQQVEATEVAQSETNTTRSHPEEVVSSDAVYFIQMADSSGEIVTSIIDPNDITSYSESIVYKQCMGADGQIETTIVNSGGVPVTQTEQQAMEEPMNVQPEVEQQVIYAQDLNGHLTPIDSAQSATDVAPPGKQFVYMQDSSGRIIRTIMDANQTMVPGQQVYYTQSDDGRIITSVMDSTGTEEPPSAEEAIPQQHQESQPHTIAGESGQLPTQATAEAVTATSAFAMDNSMSGLNMLAELSHLTAGHASAELKGPSSTDSNSRDTDMEEFRPVAMITRRVAEDGVEVVKSGLSSLKFAQDPRGIVPQESMVTRLVSEIKTESSGPGETVSHDNLFVQWQNLDAMCWMDVVLVMLVYSPTLRPLVNLDSSHELACTLLIKLLKANRQAQILLQNLLKRSSEANLQTGAGNIAVLPDAKSSKLVCKENMDEIGKAINILYAMREKIWQALQPRLRCERGKHNSPVLVLPLLVREKPIIKQMFTMNYRYVFKCAKCGYSQDDGHSKILPTIPAVPLDFNMKEPCFVRNCFECQAPDQRMRMKFEGLQDFVQMHFVKGLPHNRFNELSFDHNGDHYEVTGIVHYKNNPDHFIAWVRNAPGNTWMECDDLKSVITRYQTTAPAIPPSQVHMVMWERRLSPEHTLIMRDSDDTKYLASLVLTVQQPASSQADTSNANQKRLGTPIGSSGNAASLSQAGPATTFLSGLISQSQSSGSLPSRGRGSRGRGTRTPRGGMTIRRASPSVTTQMTTPRQAPTQIIRLPVSALQNSNLRGSIGASSPRYVFVGGNNGQSTQASSANSANKVVVLRSPGGSSTLSAAQLLQLLQRSGAISQSNTRITTQITRPAGVGTADTQTFIATNAPAQPEEAVPMTSTTAVITQSQVEEDNKNVSLTESQPNTVESMTSAISTDISATTESLSVARCESAPATESQEAETISVMATNSSANESSSGIQENPGTSVAASGTIRTLSMTPGEPARYIQIPNTSGGPNIVTQLVMKGGKMILVPVDKNSQAQVSSTPSIIRLPGSAIKSSQLNTSTISSPTILQTNTSLLSSTSSTSTVTSPQYITLPGSQVSGNKRTIQLISVPRGANSTGAQTTSKTIIVSPASNQTSPRIVADPEASVSGRETMSQTGNILIREVKRPEDSSSSIINTIPAIQSVVEGSTNTVSSSTVSLLREMNLKSVGKPASEEPSPVSGISLLSGSQVTLSNKPQESFKYILPGSSLHQMSAIQNVSGPQSGRAFTALSSSGTIIGGHLTPTSGVISVDQGTSVETVGDGTQTIYTTIKDDDTPIVRGRGRGRGQRGGRGRGVRARGRGRQQLTDTVSISTHPQSKVVKRGGTISMLSADLRQVGGQIIESSTEDVDGVPVVSIPDFSGVGAMQTESVSAAESLRETISQTDADMSESVSVSKQEDIATSVITQTIPAIKGNHGFDILTQGILGTSGQPANTSPRKSGISLLTGKTVVPSSSFSSTISLEASKTQQSLAMGQSVTQNEIETLIKAAQGAAKPPKPGDTSVISSMLNSYTNSNLESLPSTNASQAMEFSPDRFIGAEISSDINQVLTGGIRKENEGENLSNTLQSSSAELQEHPKQMEEERIVSVDESQVSAAERYRMPTELFQPDDESPEKPVKSDLLSRQLSGSQILGEDLPSKLFQDSEISSQEDDLSLSPQRQPKSPPKGSPHGPVNKSNEEYDDTTTDIDPAQLDESLVTSRAEADMEVDTEIGDAESEALLPDVKSPGKRGRRSKGKGKAKGRGGRKKSVCLSDTQESPQDTSPPQSMSQIKSPENGQQLDEVELPEDEKGSLDIQASPKHETTSQISPIRSKDSDFKSEDGEVQKSESKDSETDQLVTQFEPAVVRTKAKVSWGQDESQLCPFPFMFNYQILTRKHKKNGHRHKSLGPQETCFTSPPEPLPLPIKNNKDNAHMPLRAVVNRHRMKALERPTVDPSKEPTVIPLVAEEDGDPACTGGSVVTSHIDGEVFTGVIVRQRREIADWSCGLEDEEEEEFNDGDLMEDKDVAREYAETMWTAMCMEIGDFSVFDVSDSEYDCDFEEEGVSSDDSFDQGCESSGQNLETLPKIENVADKIEDKPQEVSHQSLPENSSPKRKRSIPDDIIVASPLDAHSPKRPKIDHAISPLKEETEVSITSDISKKVDMNGISSNQVSSSNTDQDLPSAMLSSARSSIKQESFASPARRSSRTPIPSFKIRDLDEKPLKNTTKGRRSSVLSSDDDHSGYNSDEVSLKKGKKKPAKTMLVESAPL